MTQGFVKITAIGNLGADPEFRTFPSGDEVVNFNVASTSKWKDKQSGQMKEHTEWVRCSVRGGLVKVVRALEIQKGSRIYLEGTVKTKEIADGNNGTKKLTEVVLSELNLLSHSKNHRTSQQQQSPQQYQPAQQQQSPQQPPQQQYQPAQQQHSPQQYQKRPNY